MRRLNSSRQGHVPTFLLLIEGLALMLVAWFAFFNQIEDIDARDASIRAPLMELVYTEEYVSSLAPLLVRRALEEHTGATREVFVSQFREQLGRQAGAIALEASYGTTFFALIDSGSYTVEPLGERYVVRFSDIIVSARSGEGGVNQFSRRFDLEIVFNRTDVVSTHKVYK